MRRRTLESVTGNQEKTAKIEYVVTDVWWERLRNPTGKGPLDLQHGGLQWLCQLLFE